MGSFSQPNGAMGQPPAPHGYVHAGDVKGSPYQHHMPQNRKTEIYTAVYSGVSVYELEVNGIAVMRRRSDSWLNATQILKVAGVEKGKRTKVLEKEVQSGLHEKVQGGYGRYQGTWINYERGREFCRQYGVEELLRPILEYDMGENGTPAGQGAMDTPTKEQAMAAARKRTMYNANMDRMPNQTPNGTFFQSMGPGGQAAIQAMTKLARVNSPGPRPASGNKRPPSVRQGGSQEQTLGISSQQSMQSEGSFGINGQLDPALTSGGPYYTAKRTYSNQENEEPVRKRMRTSFSQPYALSNGVEASMRPCSPETEPNESFFQPAGNQLGHSDMPADFSGLPPLPEPRGHMLNKRTLIVNIFLDQTVVDYSSLDVWRQLPPEILDMPLDNMGATALHWSAALGKTALARVLIQKGCSIYRVNSGGESALVRAVLTGNNYDANSFPELLELLGPSLELCDGKGRTVLHHLAYGSAMKGRGPDVKYYMNCILEYVLRQGSVPPSQQSSFADPSAPLRLPRSLGLARFMSDIVNARDKAGDTALNIAARLNNKGVIHQLLEVGANPSIPNNSGLKPVDFGAPVGASQSSDETAGDGSQTSNKSGIDNIAENSKAIIETLSTLLQDAESSYRSELATKQTLIESASRKLRETTTSLTEESKRLSELTAIATECKNLTTQTTNLRRANEDAKSVLAKAGIKFRRDVSVGDADNGLSVELDRLPSLPSLVNGSDGSQTRQPYVLTGEQGKYLSELPPMDILQARAAAYKANNAELKHRIGQLRASSMSMQKKMARCLTLATGVEERDITTYAKNLRVAIESDRNENLEVGRVRDLLRKAKEAEGRR